MKHWRLCECEELNMMLQRSNKLNTLTVLVFRMKFLLAQGEDNVLLQEKRQVQTTV
jgi:cAMP phosphodiesterase